SFSFFFSSRRRHTRFSRDWSSDVCSSDLAARELPEQPRVDRPERELATFGALPGTRHVVQQPGDLRAGEIGVDDEARLAADRLGGTRRDEIVARARGPPILPDDRAVDRSAR